MTDATRNDEKTALPEETGFAARVLGHFGADVTVAVIWVALIVAIVLFSGVVSQFAYVDF